MISIETKLCSKCKQELSLDNFTYLVKQFRYNSWCHSCHANNTLAHRKRKRDQGLCEGCGVANPKSTTQAKCDSCLIRLRELGAARRAQRKEQGICTQCDQPVWSGRNQTLCYDHAEESAARNSNRPRLSLEERTRLLIQQNYRCPICTKPLDLNCVVDHAHDGTGRIRGLLHDYCNRTILQVTEYNLEDVFRAVTYLGNFTGNAYQDSKLTPCATRPVEFTNLCSSETASATPSGMES